MHATGILRLFRISVVFTPAADVTLGYACALAWTQSGSLDAILLLAACAVSTLIFGAAVAANDALDEEKDRREAPRRPIPSGTISSSRAMRLAAAAAAGALALAGLLGGTALAMAAVVVAFAAAYNFVTRANRWLGIANLALVRTADWGFGMVCAGGFQSFDSLAVDLRWIVPVGYGLYALALSGVALGERRPGEGRHGTLTFSALSVSCAGGFLWYAISAAPHLAWLLITVSLVLVVPLGARLLRPSRGVEPIVGHLVSGYLLMAALPVSALLSPAAGGILLALFALSRILSRLFPPA